MHALLLGQFFDVDIINSYSLEELRSLLITLRFVERGIRNCVSVHVGFSPIHLYQMSEEDASNVLNPIRYRIRKLESI